MHSRVIHLDNGVLAYDVAGRGEHALLLFHGAGQTRTVFRDLPAELVSQYRVIACDLFFHGESVWRNDAPVTTGDWKQLLDRLCQTEKVSHLSVLGYSIGARFALATLQVLPDRVRECFLVAPDGLINNVWFNLATKTRLGRAVFGKLMARPALLHRALATAALFHVTDSLMMRIIEHQLNTDEKRRRTFQAWTGYRQLRFHRETIQKTLTDYSIPLVVFLAAHDNLIPTRKVEAYLTRLKSVRTEILDTDHRRVLSLALTHIGRS